MQYEFNVLPTGWRGKEKMKKNLGTQKIALSQRKGNNLKDFLSKAEGHLKGSQNQLSLVSAVQKRKVN